MTQGERQNYKWRPNDNSSTTRLRYDLEAEHWYKSFKNAELKHKPSSIGGELGVIVILLQLLFSLFVLVVLGLIKFLNWLTRL
ncbi:hypothetical protein [Aequorivita flava]|uniref:DUF2970 domain-containing protein n=1 Tax=Aequorivita flava TaxID=3114371 RepID=A0AB35Z1I7_9FLAO